MRKLVSSLVVAGLSMEQFLIWYWYESVTVTIPTNNDLIANG